MFEKTCSLESLAKIRARRQPKEGLRNLKELKKSRQKVGKSEPESSKNLRFRKLKAKLTKKVRKKFDKGSSKKIRPGMFGKIRPRNFEKNSAQK